MNRKYENTLLLGLPPITQMRQRKKFLLEHKDGHQQNNFTYIAPEYISFSLPFE